MFENDTTFLAYELAYRTERLSGHRAGDRDHHLAGRRRRRTTRRTTAPASGR